MRIEPEISGVDIVVLGDFNPTIFSPRWLAAHGLIPETAADNAAQQVIHQDVAAFAADWLRLQVLRDRFSAGTAQGSYFRLRDLVLRIFTECLPYPPIRAFGINFHVHFLVESQASRDRIGTALAPLEPWGPWRRRLGLDGAGGGMTSLQMSQLTPDGRPDGDAINVKVEPSQRVGLPGRGVFVTINDHFVADPANDASESLMKRLEQGFASSLKHSEGLVDHIMSLAKPTGE